MNDKYLAGALFGDGTCYRGKNRAYAVWIDQHEKNTDIIDEIEKRFKALKYKIYRYGFLNKIRVLTYSKELFIWFKELRLKPDEYFKKLSEKEKYNFIGGLFDAEGTYTDRFVIYNGHKNLLEEIKNFFIKLKLSAYVYRFGKIYGVQIYKRKNISKLKKNIFSIKLKRAFHQVKKHS